MKNIRKFFSYMIKSNLTNKSKVFDLVHLFFIYSRYTVVIKQTENRLKRCLFEKGWVVDYSRRVLTKKVYIRKEVELLNFYRSYFIMFDCFYDSLKLTYIPNKLQS